MSERCPKDGGFIGDGGCSHRNHEHSELVKRIMTTPERITAEEGVNALKKGFTVDSVDGTRAKFGKGLLKHVYEHGRSEGEKCLKLLAFAVDAVRTGICKTNHKGIPGRKAYVKNYNGFAVIAIANKKGRIDEVFNVIPKRSVDVRKL